MPCRVVSDSSVLIDLERGSLFDHAFALRFEFCVPDLLYRRELQPYGGDQLLAKGLKVLELDSAGIVQAIRYRQTNSSISQSDAFALAMAERIDCPLLTGDARLRRLARDEDVDCHGVLWLLDFMHAEHTATPRQLYEGLIHIRDHPRCRLPLKEVNKRLQVPRTCYSTTLVQTRQWSDFMHLCGYDA